MDCLWRALPSTDTLIGMSLLFHVIRGGKLKGHDWKLRYHGALAKPLGKRAEKTSSSSFSEKE